MSQERDIIHVQGYQVSYEPRTQDETQDETQEETQVRQSTIQKPHKVAGDDTRLLVERHHCVPDKSDMIRSVSNEADAGVRQERIMTFRSAFQLYPKAVAWSILVLLAIVMEAYDKSLISNFYASPAFRRTFGMQLKNSSEYQIRSSWQTGLQNGQVCAEIVGLVVFGFATDRFGYKKVMVCTMAWLCLSILISFLATSISTLLLSQIVSGFAWGVLETMAATYAAEMLPVALRGFVLCNVNMCWLIGQLVGTVVVEASLHEQSHWAWRLPLSLQWAWAIPLLVIYWFAPESPWWLVRHGKTSSAYQSLVSLTSSSFTGRHRTIVMMTKTNEVEQRFDSARPAFRHCFEGTNIRRTIIVCVVWVAQAMCGSTLTGYAPYFYEQAGLDIKNAFSLSMGMYGMGIIGNIIAWLLLRHFGRRNLYLWGLSLSFAFLLAGGIISILPLNDNVSMWVLGSLVITMTFVYDMTIGPVCYVLVTEIPSTRLRLKTVVIARIAYNLALVINNSLAPLMLNPAAWAWKGKTCFVYAVTTLILLAWVYLYLPETRKLAYIEMDILFAKNAPAKKFKEFQQRLEGSGYFSVRMLETSTSLWHGSQGFA